MTDAENHDQAKASLPPGHPADVFQRENEAILAAVQQVRLLAGEAPSTLTREGETEEFMARWRPACERLLEVQKHYARKESLLFAYLEKHGIVEPAREMWRLDGKIKRGLRALAGGRSGTDDDRIQLLDGISSEVRPLLDAVESMIEAEQEGLLPQCLERFSESDWAEIHQESDRFGYCLVEPSDRYRPPTSSRPPATVDAAGQSIHLAFGELTAHQLEQMLTAVPIDITFVDADDRIVYYSDPPGRLFSRNPAIIGRPLVNCHPPNTENFLERMMTRFRDGKSDVVESVIEREGRMIHTRYLAVRTEAGEYQGCLELTQDITRLREFGSSGKLPTYDEAPEG